MNARPIDTYASLQSAFDHFNATLFEGLLPSCLLTVQRKNRALGYFSPKRFASMSRSEELADEIAMNPAHFGDCTLNDTLSTLVHEMCHLWQEHFGTPSRGGYHNREWAAKMREVGLIPTATGQPGGKETGPSMSHIIEPGGTFSKACDRYLRSSSTNLYRDVAGRGATAKSASKTRFTCPTCLQNAWARPTAAIGCLTCSQPMAPAV